MPSSQFFLPEEPDETNVISILDNTFTRYQSVEQARWNESNIDLRFWAGDQDYVYTYFQFAPNYGWKKFFFNIIQQPCNMVTGYQRQHRKSHTSTPVENSCQKTADQLTKLLIYANNKNYLNEDFSRGCEQAINTGMCLAQPYLDYTEDPINGDMKLKIWEYCSFLMDPYFRQPDMSDANFVWCQKYLSKKEAMLQFPDHKDVISTMTGYSTREGRFYFLPENYNIARNDLLVLSHYWFKSTRKKKMLYNRETGEVTEFMDKKEFIREYTEVFPELEEIEVDAPTWKVAVILNRTLLYVGENPLGIDRCPFVPIFWNYDPQIANYNLRVRSLVRSLRDVQFLFNRRIILNHDISESSLNTGWMYVEDSIVNEEVMDYTGQGKNIILKRGSEGAPPQKIIPNAIPPSDLQLADQLFQLVGPLTGVTPELLGASDTDTGITQMLRQGAGLVTLQKYFDQWDMSFKLIGLLQMEIIQKNWNVFKVSRILEEKPTEQFFTKNFQKYDILPSEGLNTIVQQQQQFMQLLELQQILGTQFPAEFLLKYATFQGKDDLMQILNEQQKMQAAMQQQESQIKLTLLEGELENQKATTAEKLALARERTGRTKSNIGLFEERISELTQNRSIALKNRVEAISELLGAIDKYGEMKVKYAENQVEDIDRENKSDEDREQVIGQIDFEQENAQVEGRNLQKMIL